MTNRELDEDSALRLSALRLRLRDVFAARPWLAVSEVDQGAAGTAASLRRTGAAQVLAIGVTPGVGELDPDVDLISFGEATTGTLMDSIRHADHLVRNPTADILRHVEAFDPDGDSRAVIDFTMTGGRICGRASFGARTPAWAALEDKLLAPELWAASGLSTARARIVDLADPHAVAEAGELLASALGSVWAVDNARGWHGGGEGTVWVTPETSIEDTRQRLAERHDRVRVMPFVEGLPCSIHGMVLDDATISFRPMEMFIYRDRGAGRLVYGKAGSAWTPAADDVRAMKAAASALGDELRARAGFRGIFTLDGILGSDGFVPTEINTRFGGALPREVMAPDGQALNLFLLNIAVVEGALDDIDGSALERLVVGCLDANPAAVGLLHTAQTPPSDREMSLARGPAGELITVDNDQEREGDLLATVRWGPRLDGGLMFIHSGPTFPVGPPSGPLILDIARFVDEQWDLGLPGLEAPRT